MRTLILFGLLISTITCYGNEDVIGGSNIQITDAPWQVSIGLMGTSGNSSPSYLHQCGGTIISDEIIITAAHCVSGVNNVPTHIFAGSTDVSEIDQGQWIEIAEIIPA